MSNKTLVVLLILATSVSMMSTDIYVPSLPYLTDYFGTSAEYIKLTISLNAAAYSIGTLIHGPLSERFGRKPILIWSMAGLALFSLFCALSQSIGQFIVSRILQGLAAAAEGVIVLAIIRDVFNQRDQIRVLAIYEMVIALTPAIAPIIGGYVFIYIGWRANFIAITVIALIATWLIQANLKESTRKDLNALKIREILGDYFGLLSNLNFMKYSLMLGAGVGFFFAFATAGPFILIKQHGLPAEYFGYYQGIMVVAYIAGSVVTAWLAKKLAPHSLLHMALFIVLSSSLLLLFVVYANLETKFLLALCIALIAFGTAPLFAIAPPLALNTTWRRTGYAAALLVSIEMGVGALAALSVGVFHDGTSRPFALTTAVLFIGALLIYVIGSKDDQTVLNTEI
ncbi:MAG: multidrug effflux MFS transporter [Anaerolineae bacterium]|nr:multidrug effflux MFS transporter [Anaerolineae bacterium]